VARNPNREGIEEGVKRNNKGVYKMEITERDYLILRTAYRFKFCLGRHLKVLADFTGQRATDRRLRALTESGYIARRKYLYGLPYLYTLTHKGRTLIGANKREDKIRVDRIAHDIYVVDAVIFFIKKYHLCLQDISTEKELNIKNGFGTRKHQPDFVFSHDSTRYAVEVELNPKAKERQEKNVKDNYLAYDTQIWVTDDKAVFERIQRFMNVYGNIKLIDLKEVLKHG